VVVPGPVVRHPPQERRVPTAWPSMRSTSGSGGRASRCRRGSRCCRRAGARPGDSRFATV